MAIYVPLPRPAFEKLIALAKQERRRPSDQAAILLEKVLLPDSPQEGKPQ